MAVVTPDGIVGRVLAEYPYREPGSSVTDAGFAAAVESQKNHTRGVLKGMGSSTARVDYVPEGQKVERGETFFHIGRRSHISSRNAGGQSHQRGGPGDPFQTIYVEPFGAEAAPEEVFVIVDPVHQEIPDAPAADSPVFLGPDTKGAEAASGPETSGTGTQADQIVEQYKKIGAAQNHVYGEGGPGSTPPNFNLKVPGVNAPAVALGASGRIGASGSVGRMPRPFGASGATVASGFVRRVPRPLGASGATVASGFVRRVPRPLGASGATGARAARGGAFEP